MSYCYTVFGRYGRTCFPAGPCVFYGFQVLMWYIPWDTQERGYPRMAGRLRAKQIETLQPGRHSDGGTLFLVVEPGGRSRHWVQRLTVDGRRRDLGLGGYPYVGLAEARAAAFANRQVARRRRRPDRTGAAVEDPDVPQGV